MIQIKPCSAPIHARALRGLARRSVRRYGIHALELPSGLRTSAPREDWVAQHRAVWALKPVLRRVYMDWFARLRSACPPDGPILELGSGPGFLKTAYPEVMATDRQWRDGLDAVLDAGDLPFASGRMAGVVLLDVFHHLAAPADFLREAARILRPGGRVALLEPWVGLAGRLFYRYLHHEACDLRVEPAAPWRGVNKKST